MKAFDETNGQIVKEIATSCGIDLVVLFGSQAKAKATEESDIDIGIFRKSGELNLSDQTTLSGKFAELFKSNKVDISIISSNNPVLMYNILKNGKVLYSTENSLVAKLRLYSWKLLAESKSFRDHSFSILKNRIASL